MRDIASAPKIARHHTPITGRLAVTRSAWIAEGAVVHGGQTLLRRSLNRNVADWFRAYGKGQLTGMKAVVCVYVNAQKRSA